MPFREIVPEPYETSINTARERDGELCVDNAGGV
jgi:hypothetical protein